MKKKVLLLVGLMLCLLLVGCGKSGSDEVKKPIDMAPDPNQYFTGANITLLINDDDGFYYMIEKYSDTDFDKYVDALKSSAFTEIDYSTSDDNGKIYYIYDKNHDYRIECTLDNKTNVVNIICNKQKK